MILKPLTIEISGIKQGWGSKSIIEKNRNRKKIEKSIIEKIDKRKI